MICISLNKQVNCEQICEEIVKYVEKNIKSKEQAEKSILKICLIETQNYEEVKKIT